MRKPIASPPAPPVPAPPPFPPPDVPTYTPSKLPQGWRHLKRPIVLLPEPRRNRRTTGERILQMAESFDGRKSVPMIRIRGQWLDKLGFSIGERIVVREERDRIVLTIEGSEADD